MAAQTDTRQQQDLLNFLPCALSGPAETDARLAARPVVRHVLFQRVDFTAQVVDFIFQ